MIGSISSPASLAASQVAAQSQTAQIVVAGTAQKITTQGNKWVFRSPVPDTKLAGDLATFIHDKFPNVKKIAFLYVNDDFGRGGFETFKAGGQKYGFEIVAEERYARGDLDFTAQLGRIKASRAQALVEWSRYAEGALVAKQFVQMNMTMPRFGCDGVALPKYIELGGDAVNGVFYMTHYSSATTANIPAAQSFHRARSRRPTTRWPTPTMPKLMTRSRWRCWRSKMPAARTAAAIRDALSKVSFDSVRGPFKFDDKGDPLLVTHVVKIVSGKETNGRDIPVQK